MGTWDHNLPFSPTVTQTFRQTVTQTDGPTVTQTAGPTVTQTAGPTVTLAVTQTVRPTVALAVTQMVSPTVTPNCCSAVYCSDVYHSQAPDQPSSSVYSLVRTFKCRLLAGGRSG